MIYILHHIAPLYPPPSPDTGTFFCDRFEEGSALSIFSLLRFYCAGRGTSAAESWLRPGSMEGSAAKPRSGQSSPLPQGPCRPAPPELLTAHLHRLPRAQNHHLPGAQLHRPPRGQNYGGICYRLPQERRRGSPSYRLGRGSRTRVRC